MQVIVSPKRYLIDEQSEERSDLTFWIILCTYSAFKERDNKGKEKLKVEISFKSWSLLTAEYLLGVESG